MRVSFNWASRLDLAYERASNSAEVDDNVSTFFLSSSQAY